jgi:hypothetical protein
MLVIAACFCVLKERNLILPMLSRRRVRGATEENTAADLCHSLPGGPSGDQY